MSDTSYLDWPFFELRHRALSTELEAWVDGHLHGGHGGDVDQACRVLVHRLGEAGKPPPELAEVMIRAQLDKLVKERQQN